MKIGFLSQPFPGHLYPMTALGRKLQSRGHEVVFISVPDAEPIVRAAGLDFVSFGEKEFPVGSVAKIASPASKLHGFDVVKYTTQNVFPGLVAAGLKHLEEKIVETGVEALVIDTVYFYLEFVPVHLGMPYVHIWNMLNVDFSGTTPPSFFSWPHQAGPEAVARNVDGVKQIGGTFGSLVAVANEYAEKVGLKVNWSDPGSTASKLAIISQVPKEFDFPGAPWPPQFHYAGPLHEEGGREPIAFPWEKLDGRPLIYASMGTVLNGLAQIYKTILKAVASLSDVQLVLSVGHNIDLKDLGSIPSNTIVVRTAPQLELLKRASLCITHAGMNTAMESLGQGVPMVAIPISYDQPGVASRIAHHGVVNSSKWKI